MELEVKSGKITLKLVIAASLDQGPTYMCT